jgi:hypothetical protein
MRSVCARSLFAVAQMLMMALVIDAAVSCGGPPTVSPFGSANAGGAGEI